MIWYKKLGFHSNPFSIKPAAFHDEIIGQNLNGVMEKVDKGGFVFVTGDYGAGKTTVLKRIINHYRGKGKLIYINLEFIEEVKIKKLLKKRANILQRMMGRLPRETILLVDEAQLMKKPVSKETQNFFDKGFIKSVVFVGREFYKRQFSSGMVKSLKGSLVSLKTLTPQQAIKLVRKRIGNVLLSDKIIKEIFSYSNNPRTLLENCEDVCKYVINTYSNEADSQHVKAVLGKKRLEKKKRVRKKKPKKEVKGEEKEEAEFHVKTEEYPKYSEYTFEEEL